MMGYETRINVNGYGYGFGNGNGNGIGYSNGWIIDGSNYEERESGSEGGDNDNSPVMMNGGIGVSGGGGKMFPASSSSSSSSSSSPRRYIEHHVTKMDTLAGVAIRYGVEVADIKKMNGLVTDLQMFALKTLQIPLPGRHPPSPCLSNGHSTAGPSSSEHTPRHTHSDLLDSFQSLKLIPDRKLSPAMCSLRDYYGLSVRRNSSEGCEMAIYSKGSISNFQDEASLMNPPLNHHRRSKSVANGFKTKEDEVAVDVETNYRKWIDKLTLRPQKLENDTTRTPEKLLREESGSGGWFSAITGKGLALRTKAGSRTNLASEAESGSGNGFPFSLGDSAVGESSSGVRKSSSTPSLQEQENASSSIWSASKWNLKPDLQAALSNPIFDGLPKPITGRRVKTALD